MNLRDPAIIVPGAVGAGVLFLPGRGLMIPSVWFGSPRLGWLIPMAILIFCVVYFGVLAFWKLLTGDKVEKPYTTLLALFLAVRLTVDCARILAWR